MATRAEQRRARIIAAARMLFAENGFHNTGIAQIARQSGVLVGQMYRDFANKEEIVVAIVELDLEQFLADTMLREAVAAGDEQGVRAWIAHLIAGNDDHDPRLIAEIIAESSRSARISALFLSVQERLRSSLAAALAILAPHPEKRHRHAMVTEVIMTISAGVLQRRIGEMQEPDPALIDALIGATFREIDLLQRETTR